MFLYKDVFGNAPLSVLHEQSLGALRAESVFGAPAPAAKMAPALHIGRRKRPFAHARLVRLYPLRCQSHTQSWYVRHTKHGP